MQRRTGRVARAGYSRFEVSLHLECFTTSVELQIWSFVTKAGTPLFESRNSKFPWNMLGNTLAFSAGTARVSSHCYQSSQRSHPSSSLPSPTPAFSIPPTHLFCCSRILDFIRSLRVLLLYSWERGRSLSCEHPYARLPWFRKLLAPAASASRFVVRIQSAATRIKYSNDV